MTTTHEAPAADLADLVGRVPGVTRLYPAADLVGQVSSVVASAISGAPAEQVVIGPDRIAIRIGVGTGRPAAAVCRDVYTAARAWSQAAGIPDAVIEVTAASIETTDADLSALPQPDRR